MTSTIQNPDPVRGAAFDLTGKRALVTGASRGIGRAITIGLAAQGARVLAVARSSEGLAETVKFSAGVSGSVKAHTADLRSQDEIERSVEAAVENLGGLDILVNNAADDQETSVDETDLASWQRVLELNLQSCFLMAKAASSHLQEGAGGKVINIASMFGCVGVRDDAAYVVSKHGVVGLTRVLALEWARRNVQVNGVAGYLSGKSYKLGFSYPYVRMQRSFLRQTINLGGEGGTVAADINQFANTFTSNRLVLTVGKFGIVDIFDTNKYANNPKTDFLNWALINAGTFDYAGDAWGYTYGGALEWYQDWWTLRGGVFDLSATPAGGVSPASFGLDSTFNQFQMVGELESRYELWGQPGKLKVTGFLSRGRAGAFQQAINLAQLTGQPADITAVRTYASRPGVSSQS